MVAELSEDRLEAIPVPLIDQFAILQPREGCTSFG